MQKKTIAILSATGMAILTSCSSKLGALSADNFNVTPNPMEVENGQVSVTINGLFPEKYMKKKAVVKVTPELRYDAQSVKGQASTFQGEKVLGNNQTISYKVGGRYSMKNTFQYLPAMQQSNLYLTFDAKVGKKKVAVPEVKVAEGVIATSELYRRTLASAQPSLAEDAFQRAIAQRQEANVQFLIGQAQLRQTELKNNSVQEFVKLLSDIAKNQESMIIDNVEVSAYASPDGGYDINERLAEKRKDVTGDYVGKEMKKANADGPLDTKYTAEDWEGFQELVAASNIQDKDVILRVLSMYKDPEEREQQIRNISVAFKELADGILPQLRRARMAINYQLLGRDDEQIIAQLNEDVEKLSLEELLYSATLFEDNLAKQKDIYTSATMLFPNDPRAYNDVALVEYAKGNIDEAEKWLNKARQINPSLPETNANLGLLALTKGNVEEAESFIARAANANNLQEILGNLHLAQGKYALAEQDFEKVFSNSAALAQILNQNYSSAETTLKYIKNADGMTDYLKAILYARTGKNAQAADALKAAIAKDSSLASYARKDLELKNVSK